MKKPLQLAAGFGGLRSERRQPLRKGPDIFTTLRTGVPRLLNRAVDQPGHQNIYELAQGFVEVFAAAGGRKLRLYALENGGILRDPLGYLFYGVHFRGESVIQI